jgi:sulfonate transport system ATP-binding protein
MNVATFGTRPDGAVRYSANGAPLRLRGVTKCFGANAVLHKIDLDIAPGQFVAIVGRSGCGKSTLLRLLAGLDRPTAGEIDIDGATSGWQDHVRLMFQEPRLLSWQRVAANVAVGLSHAPRGADRLREAQDALDQVGLGARGGEWPSVLSGGQKQRVALARALVSHPRVLAFDEPLGALDALTRIEMQELILRVWRNQGFTAVLVTHDVSEAIALADRILVLEDGAIAEDFSVGLKRPRDHGEPEAARIERAVLDRLLSRAAA